MTVQDIELPVMEPEVEPEGSRWGKAHHVLLAFLAVALIVWLLSGFYKVNADEVAIVERLGAFVTSGNGGKAALVEQGLHYRLPWPIDEVFKIPVQQTRTLTVDTFFAPQEAYADYKRDLMREYPWMTPDLLGAIFDPYLITGDKNVVHMSIAVTYRIDDPEAWLMSVSHEGESSAASVSTANGVNDMREQLFQQIVQHAMIKVLAKLPVDNVLFQGQDQLPPLMNDAVQKAMELPDPSDPLGKKLIELGVQVQRVDTTAIRWPQYQLVDEAFQRVLKSKSDADSARFAAQSDAQAAITQAQAQRATMVQQAQAYAKQVSDEAQGEASRFQQVYEQYQKAPDVTRWNVFAEAAKSVSSNARRMLFVEPGQKTVLTIDPPQFDATQVQTGK